jgi:hypothetical protein
VRTGTIGVMANERRYPFAPRSNRLLAAGQYWAIPLSNGRFGCGRVMAVPAFGEKDRVGVVIGLMDWVGDEPPTSDRIAGHQILEQAKSRFDAITRTGGEVLGNRPLELDDLVPIRYDGVHIGAVARVWGSLVIRDLAEQYFTP